MNFDGEVLWEADGSLLKRCLTGKEDLDVHPHRFPHRV